MDLSTTYMGLELRNPLVASASPLSHTVDGVRRLADAGVGAVVLHSLFEEQVREEAELDAQMADAGTESFAESLSYFPEVAEEDYGPRRHLSRQHIVHADLAAVTEFRELYEAAEMQFPGAPERVRVPRSTARVNSGIS